MRKSYRFLGGMLLICIGISVFSLAGDTVGNQGVDFTKITPLQLIEKLKAKYDKEYDKRVSILCYIEKAPKGWIKEKDLPELIMLIDDKTRCSALINGLRSAGAESTTVGDMVAYMINGYLVGEFPLGLGSDQTAELFSKEKIKSWWKNKNEMYLGVLLRNSKFGGLSFSYPVDFNYLIEKNIFLITARKQQISAPWKYDVDWGYFSSKKLHCQPLFPAKFVLWSLSFRGNDIYVSSINDNWVTVDDLPYLMSQLDSNDVSYGVFDVDVNLYFYFSGACWIERRRHDQLTTIGDEAVKMVSGYILDDSELGYCFDRAKRSYANLSKGNLKLWWKNHPELHAK